jgi:carbonic anhydrase
MITADQALQRLQEGNSRFVAGKLTSETLASPTRRDKLVEAQRPFAIILGCSDSRVPAEIVFDQGLGDLFVIRVAGNVVAPSQIGSIEYCAEMFGTQLVVVLGHSSCGAVVATLQELQQPSENRSPNLTSIVSRIQPAVEKLLEQGITDDTELAEQAVQANIRQSMEQLQHGSEILEGMVAAGKLVIVGAEYSLETGQVEFLD